MSDHGATTPVQPVGRGGGRAALAVVVALVGLVGLLAWQPWSTPGGSVASSGPEAGRISAGSGGPGDSATPDEEAALLAVPTTGPWSGRIAGEWSIVAFLRPDRVSRDALELDQQPVTVFGSSLSQVFAGAAGGCGPTSSATAAAHLPTGEVRFLGVAYPPERQVTIERVVPPGTVATGTTQEIIPVALGQIAGPQQPPAADLHVPGWAAPIIDPVHMFGLTGGGPWPDGLYRFEVVSGAGPPDRLYACIGA